ncbi:MAG: ATP-binding protein [Deltaproteobacteria bacterium]|nr:ATP-binding protein [Deltaproteobacteria bacterium]
MTAPTRPAGQPDCPICKGQGYVIRPGPEHAQATLCECVGRCPLCDGTGFRVVEGREGAVARRCTCRVLPDRIDLFNRAGIPARHATSTFESFDVRRNPGARGAFSASRTWLKGWRQGEENRGLILTGPVGRGKTHLLCGILRSLVFDHGVEVRFVEFTHLLSALKAGFDEGIGEAVTLQPLVRVPVLAIDELGKGRATEWELAIVDSLVSRRYNALATVLATTNFRAVGPTGCVEANLADPEKAPSLGDRVGERVFSRLKEMCQFVPVGGEDYRCLVT